MSKGRCKGVQCCSLNYSVEMKFVVMTIMMTMMMMSFTSVSEANIVTCPSLVPQFSPATLNEDEVYLNLQNRINCEGKAVAWRVCYYPPDSTPDDLEDTVYSVTVGVWRQIQVFGINLYDRVKFEKISMPALSIQNSFSCFTKQIDHDQRFNVSEGDIVGFYTTGLYSFEEVLNVKASTNNNQNWYLAQRPKEGTCRFTITSSLRVSCFGEESYMYGYAMHVSVLIESINVQSTTTSETSEVSTTAREQPIATTSSSPPVSTAVAVTTYSLTSAETTTSAFDNSNQLPLPTTSDGTPIGRRLDEETQTTALVPNESEQDPNTAVTIPDHNNEGVSSRNNLIISATIPIVIVAVIILILILIVVVAIVMNCRRKTQLLNFKRRKYGEHRHIGLDHFVIVSDMAEVPAGSIVSSPLSLEPSESSYIEPHSSVPSKGASIIKNPHINTYDALCNPIYGVDDNCIYQVYSSETESSDSSKVTKPCSPYEVPVECAGECHSQPSLPGPSTGTNRKISSSSEKNANVAAPYYAEVDKSKKKRYNSQAISIPKLVMDPDKYSSLCEHYYKVLEEEMSNGSDSRNEKFTEPAKNVEDLYAQVHKQKVIEIPEKDIKIQEVIGLGQFGSVSHGILKNSKGDVTEVALKTLVGHPKSIIRVKILQEAAIMGQFFHPNVIKLLGVTTKKDALMLVIEYATKGDLKKLLVSLLPDPGELLAPETDRMLLGFCQQVAFGMHYLSTKGFVHRDLAARNILVTQDSVLKIADFGMSRDLADDNYYISHGGKVPVKWTAPEAIHYLKYSTASDVWSYGCLLYEIWSLGQIPFNDCSNSEAVEKLQKGYRLPPPPGCSRTFYSIMMNCWHPEAQARPIFKDILMQLLDNDKVVLKIPKHDSSTHSLADRVGGPLEAGEKMYTDLQWKYFTASDDEEHA